MHNFSDEELITIYQKEKGDRRRKAFDCLYLRYSKPLTQYFYYAFQNDFDKSKDFLHDLFLKILESPENFDTGKPFKPWIYKVASNMRVNNYRRAEVFNKYHSETIQNETIYAETNNKSRVLSECIGNLKQEQRSLIVLRFKIGLSIKEIATIFECPEGTIKSRLFYATKELAKLYKNQDYE